MTAIIAGAVIFANGIFDLIYYLRVWADFYSRGSLFEGIIMMFFSPNTVKTAAIMTGVIFIINAVIDGVILYRIHKISRQCAEKIQDTVDELSGNIIDEDDVK